MAIVVTWAVEVAVNCKLAGLQAAMPVTRRIQMPTLDQEYNIGTGNKMNISIPETLHVDTHQALGQLALT